ncbi:MULTISPECIES: GNAT family N-acetyltransferase [Bacillaceae]|uniref:GNAT family N-acetyltransferase n=1 Tax=Metabacillus endolithicus TaxID=1535204 RepID=A0ABW5BYG9_9BACI|nr:MULTISPECIES: GNAT family N-acetyltransferase [Bacillaceae]PGT77069.1 GNAT family N-acetyltransferase [Bacillus sp. AFS040349]UPG64011.1 GNAT family N-acetyltransferase [Metabacillus endolithicus]
MSHQFSDQLPSFEQFVSLHEASGLIKSKKGTYTREQLYQAAENSWYHISIYDQDQLIAFGRMISDGVYQALICDVMVDPSYQKQGLGKKIIEALLQKCKDSGIQSVQLFSAKGKQQFYKKLGFEERELDAPGMSLII